MNNFEAFLDEALKTQFWNSILSDFIVNKTEDTDGPFQVTVDLGCKFGLKSQLASSVAGVSLQDIDWWTQSTKVVTILSKRTKAGSTHALHLRNPRV
jgi:hypothetical protein